MREALASFARALFRPDIAFAGPRLFRLSRLALAAALFLLVVAGERLTQGYYQSPQAKTLALLEVESRMSGIIQNAPADVQRRMREQMLASVVGERSAMLTSMGIVLQGLGFLAVCMESWLLCMVLSQFFGGQEDRHGSSRPSLSLFLLAFVPLALRRLLGGLLMTLRNPEAASNALTLAEYRDLSAVRFDFYSVLRLPPLPGLLAAMARLLTDPFLLWTMVILCLGGRDVYRFSMKSAVLQSLLLVLLLSLQAALLSRVGFTGGL